MPIALNGGIVSQVGDRCIGVEAADRLEELSGDSHGLVRILGRIASFVDAKPTPGHGDCHGGNDRNGDGQCDSPALAGVGNAAP
jgi:hypothetical protein